MTVKKFNIAFLLCVLTAFGLLFTVSPYSAEAVEDNKSITLSCESNSKVIPNMYWKIIKIGERRNGKVELTGFFSRMPIKINLSTTQNLDSTAKVIKDYSVAGNIRSYASGYTDRYGDVVFDDLENGIYLAYGFSIKMGIYFYRPSPLIFEISSATPDDYTAFPKFYSNATAAEHNTRYTVKKVWNDYENSYDSRPNQITVCLYKNGEYYDEVNLNETNKWEHTWDNLDPDPTIDWTVIEKKVPARYEVEIDYNSTQYLIKNSYNPQKITDFDFDEWEEEIETETSTTATSTLTGGVTYTSTDTKTTAVTTSRTTDDSENDTRQTSSHNTTHESEHFTTLSVTALTTKGTSSGTTKSGQTSTTTSGTNKSGQTGTDTSVSTSKSFPTDSGVLTSVSGNDTSSGAVNTTTKKITDYGGGSGIVTSSGGSRSTTSTKTVTTVVTAPPPPSSGGNNNSGGNSNSGGSSTGGKLPQTGQHWIEVFLLASGGFIFIMAGLAVKPKRNNNA